MLLKRRKNRTRWNKYRSIIEKEIVFFKPEDWEYLRNYENRKRTIYNNNKKLTKFDKKIKIKNNLLTIPANLDFETNISEMDLLIKRFKNYSKINTPNTRIDLSKLNNVSINSLIVILSEIDKLQSKRKRIRYNFKNTYSYNSKYGVNKNNQKLKYLLYAIGYWDYFGIKKPYKIDNSIKDEYFLAIKSDVVSDSSYVAELREFIKEKVNFIKNDIIEEYFDDAITEAMANSVEHGYIENRIHKKKGKWWLCGHYDKQNEYLEFSFRDYGVGFRKTLEYNADNNIKSFVRKVITELNKNDSEIIQLLVNNKLPKYKNNKEKVRGYGFKKFKEFAKNVGYNCEMKILSNSGKYKYCFSIEDKNEKEILSTMPFDLDGVIINWKLFLGEKK